MICLAVISLLSHDVMMQKVIDLAQQEVAKGGLPFAAMVVNAKGEIISQAVNTVADSHDPTDHAEIRALRLATQKLNTSELKDHEVYAIGHPCSMCLAALTIAKPKKIYFAASLAEKNRFLKLETPKIPMQRVRSKRTEAIGVFKHWADRQKSLALPHE
jgi:tRNA(Arg) A34 adenosine deaminase TadA